MRWPMVSRTIQRLRLASTSRVVTFSPSCHFRPSRSLKVQTVKSALTSWPSHIWGLGVMVLSTP